MRFPTIKSKTCEICGIRVSPNPTHKSGIRVSLKCPPTSVRFPTLKSKTCEICGIRVSPNPTHKSEIRVSQAAHTHKAGIRVKKKAPRVGWVPLPSEPFLEKNYCYLLWFLCFDDKHKGSGYHKVNTCQSEHIRL